MSHPIATARTQQGMTQTALAEACGLDRSTISRIEGGTRSRIETYRLIGKVLGLDWRLLVPEEK